MNLKHNQRTPKGVIAWFEMGQQMMKLKKSITKYTGNTFDLDIYTLADAPV